MKGLIRLKAEHPIAAKCFEIAERKSVGLKTPKLGPEIGPRLHRTQLNSLDVIRSIRPDPAP